MARTIKIILSLFVIMTTLGCTGVFSTESATSGADGGERLPIVDEYVAGVDAKARERGVAQDVILNTTNNIYNAVDALGANNRQSPLAVSKAMLLAALTSFNDLSVTGAGLTEAALVAQNDAVVQHTEIALGPVVIILRSFEGDDATVLRPAILKAAAKLSMNKGLEYLESSEPETVSNLAKAISKALFEADPTGPVSDDEANDIAQAAISAAASQSNSTSSAVGEVLGDVLGRLPEASHADVIDSSIITVIEEIKEIQAANPEAELSLSVQEAIAEVFTAVEESTTSDETKASNSLAALNSVGKNLNLLPAEAKDVVKELATSKATEVIAALPNLTEEQKSDQTELVAAAAEGQLVVSDDGSTTAAPSGGSNGSLPSAINLSASVSTLAEDSANNGTISAGITLTIDGSSFVTDSFVAGTHYNVSGVPAGMTLVIERAADDQLDLSLSGAAANHANINDRTLYISFKPAALSTSDFFENPLVVIELDFADPRAIAYSVSEFNEAGTNDGSIATVVSITASGDEFRSGPWTAGTEYTLSGVPSGLTAVLTVVDSATVTMALSGQADDHAAMDSSSVMLSINAEAMASGNAPTVGQDQTFNVIYNDPVTAPPGGATLTASAATLAEAAANDGSISASINIDVSDGSLVAGALSSGTHYVAGGVPLGMTLNVARVNSTRMTVSLSGNANNHTNVNDAPLVLSFLGASLATGGYFSNPVVTISLDFNDPSQLSFNTNAFLEAGANDGSITTVISATIAGDSFTAGPWSAGNQYSWTGIPSGLTGAVAVINSTTLSLSLSGQADDHYNANDVATSFSLNAAGVTSGTLPASGTPQSLTVDYDDPDFNFAFQAAVAAFDEDAGLVTVNVILPQAFGSAQSVDVNVESSSTADVNDDYTIPNNTVTFGSADTTATFAIAIAEDAAWERTNETLELSLSNPTGGIPIGAQNTMTVTINDNDAIAGFCATGTLDDSCVVSSQQIVVNNTKLIGAGDLIIANGGEISTTGTDRMTIDVGGRIVVQNGGLIDGNLAYFGSGDVFQVSNGGVVQGNIEDSLLDSVDVQAGGIISANATGHGSAYVADAWPAGFTGVGGGYRGGFHAGYGGGYYDYQDSDCTSDDSYDGVKQFYGNPFEPTTYGSSGSAAASSGGGRIKLISNGNINVVGDITANGLRSGNTASAGAGGSIWLHAAGTLNGNGTIAAAGASGNQSTYHGCGWWRTGGGGGGRIAVVADGGSTHSGTISVAGGDATSGSGNANNRAAHGSLYTNFSGTRTLEFADSSGYKNYVLDLDQAGTIDSLNVANGATLDIENGNSQSLSITSLTVAAGGKISADGLGYECTNIPAELSASFTVTTASGGTHGGVGGSGYGSSTSYPPNTNTYGDAMMPTTSGMPGKYPTSTSYCYRGGGALKITVSGTMTINGTISSNGVTSDYNNRGSGAGGSVWLVAGFFAGSGAIEAHGGDSNTGNASWYGGAGGGGRIALYGDRSGWSGTATATAGGGQTYGTDPTDGTVYLSP